MIVSPALIVIVWVPLVAVFPCESVTFTVKVSVPALVGVPLITPPLDKLSGVIEPVANANVYPLPDPPLAVYAGAV